MKVKTTMRYHFTGVQMAINKKSTKKKNAGEGMEKREELIGTATIENSMETPQRTKNRVAI